MKGHNQTFGANPYNFADRVNDEDVHCPTALYLDSSLEDDDPVPRFTGKDADSTRAIPDFNTITKETDLDRLTSETWSNRDKVDGIHLVIIRSLSSCSGRYSPKAGGQIFLETLSSLEAMTHEWGHYQGGLYDIYVCSECLKPPNAPPGKPKCRCIDPPGRTWLPSPDNPYNIMSNTSSEGILPSDKAALVR